MSQTVQTQFGIGTVVARESVRGRVSYKVEGPGFSTWIEASVLPVDFQWMPGPDDIQDNSVTLPYNPAPQTWRNPADQNIVPGQQGIDPQKRTAPADSVDLQEDGESYEPGPDPKLFAANWERTRGEPSVALRRIFPDGREGRITRDGMGYSYELDINNSVLKRALGETYETASQAKQACEEAWEFHNIHNPRESGLSPEDIQAKLGPKYVNAFVEHDFDSLQARLTEHPEIVMSEYRERVGELVAQTDQDYLSRIGRNEHLEAADPQLREAAWKDVRAKAVRLRHSGQVNTRGATPDIIATQVTGDHGTYEVIVRRSNIFQGNSAVDDWSCECPWGKWAWKREHQFVGRMCSHAYASLMELQALSKSKTPNPKFRNHPAVWASRTAGDSDYVDAIVEFVVFCNKEGLSQEDHDSLDYYNGDDEISQDEYNTIYDFISGDLEEYIYTKVNERVRQRSGSRTAEIVDLRPVGWDPYSRNLMNRLRDLWQEGSRPGRQKERNEEIRELVDELRERGFATDGIIASLKDGFLDRPLGYGDIPDYGTSDEYILEHELRHREDVTEPEFEYPAGGGHGVVNDLNDGGRNLTSALKDAEDVVSALEANGWSWERVSDSDFSPTFRIIGRLGSEYITSFTFDQKGSPGSLIEAQVSTQDPLGWAAEGLGKTSDLNEALGWLSQYKTSAYEDDYIYSDPTDYSGGDEFDGDENPWYVDPAEQEDWDDPLKEASEQDIVADFQRNASWLMSGGNEDSGNDDIAAYAEAHLRTAGRSFTMAEQQALIDEDDGQVYDPNNLRLRGTHYETGF